MQHLASAQAPTPKTWWAFAKDRICTSISLLIDSLEDYQISSQEIIIWRRSWIRRREERGVYDQLIRELALEDKSACVWYFRMGRSKFVELVGCTGTKIQRLDTIMRPSISFGERVAVTLCHLATGETFSLLESQLHYDIRNNCGF